MSMVRSPASALFREDPALRFRNPALSWLGGLLLSGLIVSDACAAPVYRDLAHQRVAGTWAQQTDNTYLIQPGVLTLDINQDTRADLTFEHGYRRPLFHLRQNDVDLLKTASAGIDESLQAVGKIRPLVVDSATAVVGGEDSFQANEAEVAFWLDHMDRIAANWQYQGRPVLDGSMGVFGFVTDINVAQVVRATTDTVPGHYVVEVLQAAERARVVAPIAQDAMLSNDETVSVNGIAIQLFAGMTNSEVIDRMNEYSSASGGLADIDGFTTRVYTDAWGSSSELDIASNRPASPISSGFGNTRRTARGIDATIEIEGGNVTGQGRTVSIDSGLAKGLSLVLSEDSANPTSTVAAGTVFGVTVIDQSLDLSLLPLNAGSHLRVAIPSIQTSSLGQGVRNSRFAALHEIEVYNAGLAQDALKIVDAAAEELKATQQQLNSVLEQYYSPDGQAFVTLDDTASGNSFALAPQPLHEGQIVNDEIAFTEDPLDIERLVLGDSNHSLLLGFRFLQNAETYYGWLRLQVDDENRLTLQDLAYESVAGRGIRIAPVPEPSSFGVTLATFFLVAGRSVRRQSVRSTVPTRK